jgi:hypothetical protein
MATMLSKYNDVDYTMVLKPSFDNVFNFPSLCHLPSSHYHKNSEGILVIKAVKRGGESMEYLVKINLQINRAVDIILLMELAMGQH